MSRMVDACKAQGVAEPEYEVNGGFVRIVFRRATKGDDSVNETPGQIPVSYLRTKYLLLFFFCIAAFFTFLFGGK